MKKRLLMLLSLFMAVTSVGWLHAQDATVSTVDDLKAAITAGKSPIKLSATTFELSDQLVINKPITIEGVSGTVLKAVGDKWPEEASKMNLISIEATSDNEAGGLQLSNMTIMNSKGAGINAQSNMKVTLNNITLKDNAKAGLLVHSEVNAYSLRTSGNVWGGVNVDKGNPAYTPSFTFDAASTFAESSKIWSELKDTESTVNAPEGWYSYLGVQGTSKEEKRYWTNSKLTFEFYQKFPNKNWDKGYTFVYANGNPVTIEQGSTEGLVKISVDNTDNVLEVETSKNPVVFGGSKNAIVSSSKITVKSGTLNMLFGGGYGEISGSKSAATAGVSGSTTITITGGTVTGSLLGGGLYYNHSKDVNINVSGDVSIGANTSNWLICGGFESGQTSGDNYLDFDKSNNTVESATLVIDGGSYGCIAIGGTDGAKGYIKNSTATVKNATIKCGVFGNGANGRSDNAQGTFTNCKFEGSALELAAVNRGVAKSISLSFDKCEFPTTGISANIGATYRWGYNYNGSTSKVEGVPGDVTFSFVGCKNTPVIGISDGLAAANVTLTGAKAKLAKFEYTKEQYHSAFTIDAGKTWTFNSGLELGTGDNAATLTNNGTLNVKDIDNVADLQAAVAVGANNIGLEAGKYELASHLLITKPVVIEGTITEKDSTVIKPASNWSASDGTNKNLIRIDASNTSLKNLLVEGSGASGIHVHKATGVTLDNVISRNNKAAGLIVNGSEVTATNFRTSGNDWYGVNVDKGQDIQSEPVFTIGAGCSFAEKVAIKSDAKNAPASYVVGNGWFKTTAKIDNKDCSIWINGATSGLDFAITSVPATVIYGQANLPLLTNVDSAYYKADKVKISILEKNQNFVEIKKTEGQPDSLVILKPGKVTLSLAVGDTTVNQPLTVLHKTLTITGITTKKARNYDGSKKVTLNISKMTVNGLVEKDKSKTDIVTAPITGEALSANAGLQPVKVTATLGDSYQNYYELAEITAVTDTIKKVELTVTATVKALSTNNTKANDPLVVDYGTLPEFGVKYDGFVNEENASSALSGALKYNCSATTTSLAGTYSVTPSGYTATNYDIKYVSAPFKIAAIAPTVEMTGVEVVSLGTSGASNASVKVTGRVTSNGGTKMEDLKGSFKVKTNGNYEVKAQDLKVENGTFSATLEGLASAETSIQAFAKAGELENTATDDKAMSVNLALKLQNVSFATTFSTLTYGIDPISLTAEGFVEDAKVTFTSSDKSILAIADSNKMSVVKPGVATITVTATKDQYITAVAKQTITVKKKALAVTPEAITKKYDGTTDVQVTGTLPELEGLQAATLSATSLDANFANKNVGTSSVKLAGEFALSVGSDYYELVQPTNLTGTIEKGGEVTVEVSNVTRNYNEKALRYDLKFLVGDKELASTEYTGTVSVTETTTGTYNVSANITAPNYGTIKANPASGNVDIIKGTPKVLTYNTENGTIDGLLLDNEGWDDAKKVIVYEDDGKAHATVIYNNGQDSIVGKSLAKLTPPAITWDFHVVHANRMMKATKADVTTQSVQYGQTATFFSKVADVSFESSNPNVFVVKESADGNSMMIETIGVGTAAIIAKGTGNSAGVTCLQVTVDPKPITLTAVGTIEKVYDGTTTAHVTLTPSEELVGASIDLTDVSFNFAQSKVGAGITVLPSKDIVLKNNNDALASAANYTISIPKLTGNITQRKLTFTGTEVNKFYDGTNTAELTDYSATGLIEGETVPALTATFKEANGNDAKNVATGLKVTLAPNSGNYKLVYEADKIKGNIVKSTIDATLPAGASSDTNLAANVALVVRETGKKVTKSQIDFTPLVSHEGSGSTAVYYISGADNDNYSVVYDKNQIGFKADQSGDGGSTTVSVSSVSLDKTELTLPRQGTYTLKATINPSDASDKSVTWKSSDESVATVDANGKVTALKVGKATITVTTVDGGKTASCEVTVDFATGLEEALANTQIYAKQGNIYVNPVQPLQLTIVNMIGKVVYNARISCYAQIPVAKGIYIVKLTNAGNTVVTKVNVY